jgi:hypothetical protein
MALGTLVFCRTAWLMAAYFENMSEMSRQRGYISLAVSSCIALLGAWLAFRRPSTKTRP